MKKNRVISLHKLTALLAVSASTFLAGVAARGQAFNFTSSSLAYSENFDAMGASGTAYLPGWTAIRGAGSGIIGQTLSMAVTDGATSSGNAYNVGTTSASDRAFGTLASGTTAPVLGASFTNSTGGVITNISLSVTNEQWKSGSSSTVNEVVIFEYSLDATNLNTGTWTALTDLNLNEQLTSTTAAAAVDGNTNKVSLSGTISSLVWPSGTTLWIRWRDADNTGSDGLYAIDDFSMAVEFQPPGTPPMVTDILPASVTTNAGSTVAFTVTYTGDPPTFYWYKETSTTNLIPSATTAVLTLPNVLAADSANYQVVLSNAFGLSTSAVVSLTVIDPVIVSEPASQTNLLNSSTFFTVGVVGTQPLAYQWYQGVPGAATLLSNGGRISGANTNTLVITDLVFTDANTYFAIITNVQGALTSSVVTLGVTDVGVLAYWDFNVPGLNPTNPAPAQGPAGSAATLAFTSNGFIPAAGGGSPSDPINSVLGATNYYWGTASYPSQGTANKQAGVQFKVSTVGVKNLSLTYDTRGTATASKYTRVQYTTNGTDYVDYPASFSFASPSSWEFRGASLIGFPGVRNNPNFGIRMVSEFESSATYGAVNNSNYVGISSTYGTSGTLNYDIVKLSAEAITNANTPPTITSIADQSTPNNAQITVNFTVGDSETAAAALVVGGTSYNQSIIADGNIVPGGSGANRSLMITPSGVDGVVPILVTVTDGNGDVTATWFLLTVHPLDLPPSITQFGQTNTLVNTPITIPFTIGDSQTPAGSLTLSSSSLNAALVPEGNIVFGGSGSNRMVTITPATDGLGVAPILILVSDGVNTATNAFTLMVRPNTNIVFNDYFDYPDGPITDASLGLWRRHSGTAGQMDIVSGMLNVTAGDSEDVNALLIGQPYATNQPFVLYSSFTVNFSALPTMAGTYFAHFRDENTGAATGFGGRVWASTTNSSDPSTYFRLGIANGSGATNTSGQFPMDLVLNSNYTVVTRFIPSNGVATIWINPASESGGVTATDVSANPTVVTNPITVTSYAFRQSGGEGTMKIDNLQIGLTFASVSGVVPPILLGIRLDGTNAILTWDNAAFSLQSSTNAAGPYDTISGATSPYTNSATGAQMFFRLMQ